LWQCLLNPFFVPSVLFTGEAAFTRNGIMSFCNCHYWAEDNTQAIALSRHQQFSISVWSDTVNNVLGSSHILPQKLTGNNYQYFSEMILPY
jgi:hypothetical protein